MRILSPVSDAPTLAPLRSETRAEDPVVNERTDTTPERAPSITPATSTIPTVVLDTDVVSHNMAARLCVSFLGHVLFLKNQVPFPIVQLARMPTSDNSTRATRKRHELLNSFDTLASHLYTTFIALSTALALRGSPETVDAGAEDQRRHQKHGVATAFFAVALGPTVGTAKSRVIVGIHGLETKVWGSREDDTLDQAIPTRNVSEEDEDDAVESASDSDDEHEDQQSEGEESGDSSEEEVEDPSGSDEDHTSPPSSRSPSPSPSSNSTEDPETVRAAERLLSRTLASACAEDDGQGLVSEMAPMQIHVLLRAPRRFDHPSWTPRQNLCASLDSYLVDFLVESGQTPATCGTTKKRPKGNKVQGVWVRSHAEVEDSDENMAEEDELIWWSWDGKLVGFADW